MPYIRPTDKFDSIIEWIISPSSFFFLLSSALTLLLPPVFSPPVPLLDCSCSSVIAQCSHFFSLLHLIISKAAIICVCSDNKSCRLNMLWLTFSSPLVFCRDVYHNIEALDPEKLNVFRTVREITGMDIIRTEQYWTWSYSCLLSRCVGLLYVCTRSLLSATTSRPHQGQLLPYKMNIWWVFQTPLSLHHLFPLGGPSHESCSPHSPVTHREENIRERTPRIAESPAQLCYASSGLNRRCHISSTDAILKSEITKPKRHKYWWCHANAEQFKNTFQTIFSFFRGFCSSVSTSRFPVIADSLESRWQPGKM